MASGFTSHLPWGKAEPAAQASKDDDTSLTTLLSADQCADLTFLIATITAVMRKSLLDTFTAEEPSPEALKAAPSNPSETDAEQAEKLRKDKQEREEDAKKELVKPEVQALKKAMLTYFDEWRGRVISRVGEIVNSREEAKEQSRSVKESDVEKGVKRQETGIKSISDMDDKSQNEDTLFRELYPPFQTGLIELGESKRALVVHSLVLILLSLVSNAPKFQYIPPGALLNRSL